MILLQNGIGFGQLEFNFLGIGLYLLPILIISQGLLVIFHFKITISYIGDDDVVEFIYVVGLFE